MSERVLSCPRCSGVGRRHTATGRARCDLCDGYGEVTADMRPFRRAIRIHDPPPRRTAYGRIYLFGRWHRPEL